MSTVCDIVILEEHCRSEIGEIVIRLCLYKNTEPIAAIPVDERSGNSFLGWITSIKHGNAATQRPPVAERTINGDA